MDHRGVSETWLGSLDVAAWVARLTDECAIRGNDHELLDPRMGMGDRGGAEEGEEDFGDGTR
jgi:hypothetical protein